MTDDPLDAPMSEVQHTDIAERLAAVAESLRDVRRTWNLDEDMAQALGMAEDELEALAPGLRDLVAERDRLAESLREEQAGTMKALKVMGTLDRERDAALSALREIRDGADAPTFPSQHLSREQIRAIADAVLEDK